LVLLDPLTRLWNRRGIMEVLPRELAHAGREGKPLSLAIADLDHFKKINDTYGHTAGDEVLHEAAQRMRAATRP